MQINIIHGQKTFPATLSTGGQAKLYSVPADYSPDGYALALWDIDQQEPLPAVRQTDYALLGHWQVEENMGEPQTIHAVFEAEGVSHAQN